MTLRSLAPRILNPLLRRTVGSSPNRILPKPWSTSAACFSTTLSRSTITLDCKDDSLVLNWPDASTTFHNLWLRDNCPCPSCVHPSNRQKLHSTGDIPLDIEPTSVQLLPDTQQVEIVWNKSLRNQSEPHKSVYPLDLLRVYSSKKSHRASRLFHSEPLNLWTRDTLVQSPTLWIEHEEFQNTDQGLYKTLRQLHDYGLVFLKNVPTEDKQVEKVCERIGEIRRTFYGKSWDVKSIANAKNIAYTSLYLGLHMDLLYFEAPPGLQFLHSLRNSVKGGASIFLDSFHAAKILRETDPAAYEVLKKTPVTYHYVNDNHHMYFKKPTFVEDLDLPNELDHVNYAPPFQGPMEFDGAEGVREFFEAFAKFEDIMSRPELTYEYMMTPGDLMIFANRRVLHGRTSFDADSGERHLKGSYVDGCVFRDRLRVLWKEVHDGKLVL